MLYICTKQFISNLKIESWLFASSSARLQTRTLHSALLECLPTANTLLQGKFSKKCMQNYRKTSIQIQSHFNVLPAPSAPPLMVEGSALDTTSIRVRWRPPLENHQNGAIAGYRIIYIAEGTGSQRVGSTPPPEAQRANVLPTDRSYTIRGLTAWTTYKIWTLAYTGAGDGPMSDVIVVQTEEGGTWSLDAIVETFCLQFVRLYCGINLLF